MSSYNYSSSSVSDKHQSELAEMKKCVKDSFFYFKENNDRYTSFMRFICDTALSDDARQKLITLNKSPVEFNECEAYISRQLGEFAKQQPSFEVRAAGSVGIENITPDLTETIAKIESFLRYLLSPQKTDNISFKTMDEMMKGGFSVWRISTDYENEMSFNQEINVQKEHYPTMCFFDPMAMDSHKGDGDYCGRIVAYKEEDAKRMFGDDIVKGCSFSSSFADFNWSYRNNSIPIVLVCEYFKKKKVNKKIVKLSNGATITKKEYKRLVELWDEAGYIEQPPIIVDERTTEIEKICRYLISETKVISYEETDFKYLPLVFFDGSSVMLEDTNGGNKRQMTRPYVYHLRGIQQVKNIAGQAMAYEIENTVAHKFMAAIESIDMTQLDQWRNVQIADVLLYQYFRNGNSDEPLPPPREIQRGQIPQIIPQTFMDASRTMQSILGSYDAQMGIQGNNLSGKAIQQGAMHTAGGTAPFLMGYINGLNRVASIVLDLIPKYYKTPRTVPIIEPDGKKGYQLINHPTHPQSIYMNYDPNMLNVCVEAGVNAEVQKQIALDQLIMMTKASPTFAQFMNEEGLEIFLDNIDIRNIESLKKRAGDFMAKMEQAKMAAAQKPKFDPVEESIKIERDKLALQSQKIQSDAAINAGKLENDRAKVDVDFINILSKTRNEERNSLVKEHQAQAENVRSDALLAIELSKHAKEDRRDKHDRYERVLIHKDKMALEKEKVKSAKKKATSE